MKLTEWHPGDVTPVRVGLYQRVAPLGGQTVYSLWDGDFWRLNRHSKRDASNRLGPSNFQHLQWRGVAK